MMAAKRPINNEPVPAAAAKPTNAPKNIVPSIPRFRIPARSQNNSPNVPKIKGVAIRKVAAKNPTMNSSI